MTSISEIWNTFVVIGIFLLNTVNIALVNPVKRLLLLEKGIATREYGQCKISLPAEETKDKIHGWNYLTSENNNRTSNSRYIKLI
jgi:hypothetical protein